MVRSGGTPPPSPPDWLDCPITFSAFQKKNRKGRKRWDKKEKERKGF